MRCSWCQEKIIRDLQFKEILLPFTIPAFERCWQCEQQLIRIDPKDSCSKCCRPEIQGICKDCQKWQQQYPDYDFRHLALFQYNEAFQEWMHQYKFLGDLRLASTFAKEIQSVVKKVRPHVIIPIPLSEARFQERGFNQAEQILVKAGQPASCFIVRNHHMLPQSGKKRHERLAMAQPFTAIEESHKIKGRKVLLVDDIYTTGRTLFHAAQVLRKFEPKEIITFSLAR